MKERIQYIPELGDSVILTNGTVGAIYSFGRHCSRGERFANVGANNEIISCPNLSDLYWDSDRVAWVVDSDMAQQEDS